MSVREAPAGVVLCPLLESPDNELRLTLGGGRAAPVARYRLSGFVQLTAGPREDKLAVRLDHATLRAAFTSIRGGERLPPGIPQAFGFGARGPVPLDPVAGLAPVTFTLAYPGLAAVPRFRTRPAPGHLPAPLPVAGEASLGYVLDAETAEISLHGLSVVRVPTFATPVHVELRCLCACPEGAARPKCRKVCLSVKVASDANGPVLSDDRVKAIVADMNRIWGCSAPGQCCIEFELKNIGHPARDKLGEKVKVNWRGPASDEFNEAARVDREADCYNLYLVKELDTVGAPAGSAILGQTKFDTEPAAIVQTADYPDATIGQLAAHELGHALGLARSEGTGPKGVDRHSSQPDNLMEPHANIPARKLNVDQCKTALLQKEVPLRVSDTDCSATPAET